MVVVGPTEALVRGVGAAWRAGVPGPVQDRAHRSLLRTLVDASVGAHRPLTGRLVEHLRRLGLDDGEFPVPGRAERFGLLDAAQILGAASCDGRVPGGSVGREVREPLVFAALLPVAAHGGASGEDLLRAAAIGCEVLTRLSEALPDGPGRAWNNDLAAGPMAASVAAGLLLGNDDRALRFGLGIVASQLVGHRESDGGDTERYLVGKAAVNGVHAALLARAGITASDEVLEHPRGFFAVLDRDREGVPASEAVAEVGDRWRWAEVSDAPPLDQLVERLAAGVGGEAGELGRSVPTERSITALLEACRGKVAA